MHYNHYNACSVALSITNLSHYENNIQKPVRLLMHCVDVVY